MLKGFKQFILRGNVVDLAVGVVIGAAFGTVVTAKEVETITEQMGPVESEPAGESQSADSKNHSSPKKLYRIAEGAIFRGVCTGLAAYFNADVTLVRIIFVILTVLTHGIGIVVYIIMMLVVPPAATSEEKAAAFGAPFKAQDFVARAREEYSKFSERGEFRRLKREWKNKMRQSRWEAKQQYYASRPRRFASPFFGLLIAVLSLFWIFGLVTLFTHGTIFGLGLPASIPLWIAVLIWLCVYSLITWPLKAAMCSFHYNDGQIQHRCHHHQGFFGFITWLAFFAVIAWALWQYVPSTHPYFDQASLWWQHVWVSVKNH